MSRLLRANFAGMFASAEFMICVLPALALGIFNTISCCVLSTSYQPTFERDLFSMSRAVFILSAVFVSLFFGTENSVVRNRLTVGHTRGAVFGANWLTAFCGVFIINALSMLPYVIAAPFFEVKLGEITAGELVRNVLIEILAAEAAGGIYLLITIVAARRSSCAAGALLSSILILSLPEMFEELRYSPGGQIGMLLDRLYTTPEMPVWSIGILTVTALAGALGACLVSRHAHLTCIFSATLRQFFLKYIQYSCEKLP